MSPVTALIYSYVFVFSIILLATIIQKMFKLSNEFSRKMIHIGVGNWVFVAPQFFSQSPVWAMIPPVTFIILNYLSFRYSIFKAMELDEKNPGTIYYAISLTILTFLAFRNPANSFLPYLGITSMTWGDGMAAVIGQKWPVKQIRPGKSFGGSMAFLVFSSLACVVFLEIYSPASFGKNILTGVGISLLGMLIEIYSPKNLDNLTVPLIPGMLLYFC